MENLDGRYNSIYSVCCVLRLARFNLTKIDIQQDWKNNFEGIPFNRWRFVNILMLIYELSDLNLKIDLRSLTPYLQF